MGSVTLTSHLLPQVNAKALEVLADIIPLIPQSLEPVLGELLPSLSLSLTSKNASIRQIAGDAATLLATMAEPNHVTRLLASTVKNASAAVQAALLPMFAENVPAAYARNPRLLSRYVIPTAVAVLDNPKYRDSNGAIWQSISDCLGPELFEDKALQKASVQKSVRALLA